MEGERRGGTRLRFRARLSTRIIMKKLVRESVSSRLMGEADWQGRGVGGDLLGLPHLYLRGAGTRLRVRPRVSTPITMKRPMREWGMGGWRRSMATKDVWLIKLLALVIRIRHTPHQQCAPSPSSRPSPCPTPAVHTCRQYSKSTRVSLAQQGVGCIKHNSKQRTHDPGCLTS